MRKEFLVWALLAPVFSLPAGAAQTEIAPATECRMIPRHVPDPDVTYRPGQDVVNGQPVPPADLEGAASPLIVPQEFEIEIDAGLNGVVSAPGHPAPLYQPRAKIGRVQVKDLEGDPSLDLNGQPLYRTSPGEASPECRP